MVKETHFQTDYTENIFHDSYSKVSTTEDWIINFYQIQKFNGIIHPEGLQRNLQIKWKKNKKKNTQSPTLFNYYFVLIWPDFSPNYSGTGNSVSKPYETEHNMTLCISPRDLQDLKIKHHF